MAVKQAMRNAGVRVTTEMPVVALREQHLIKWPRLSNSTLAMRLYVVARRFARDWRFRSWDLASRQDATSFCFPRGAVGPRASPASSHLQPLYAVSVLIPRRSEPTFLLHGACYLRHCTIRAGMQHVHLVRYAWADTRPRHSLRLQALRRTCSTATVLAGILLLVTYLPDHACASCLTLACDARLGRR
eukprot:3728646-Pleurochrysis_carterae.AAC.1